MAKQKQKRLGLIILILLLAIATGCSNTPSSTTPETTQSETTTGTSQVSFQIEVIPGALKGNAIAGQRVVYLLKIKSGTLSAEDEVKISAQSADAEISLEPASIREGQIAEITVIPKAGSIGKTVKVVFTAEHETVKVEKTLSFQVIEGEDDRQEYAVELREKFVRWLAAEHPELGITPETKWTGTLVSPQWLVVSHYLFFSDEWEMHIEWHIMIAPNDWARIDLRKRHSEFAPSSAFEISSLDADKTLIAIEVPESIWR